MSTSLRTDLARWSIPGMGLWSRQRAGQDVVGLTQHSNHARRELRRYLARDELLDRIRPTLLY